MKAEKGGQRSKDTNRKYIYMHIYMNIKNSGYNSIIIFNVLNEILVKLI